MYYYFLEKLHKFYQKIHSDTPILPPLIISHFYIYFVIFIMVYINSLYQNKIIFI